LYRAKWQTTPAIVETQFVPLFRELLHYILRPLAPLDGAAEAVHRLYRYFQAYDYKLSFRAAATWRVFQHEVLATYRIGEPDGAAEPSAFDFTTSMRWLYNFLMPLSVPVPRTDVAHATIAGFSSLSCVIAQREHGTPVIVTDHGIFARERYIAVSTASMAPFAKRFLLNLSMFVTRLCYSCADQISPVADFNHRWELRLGAGHDKIRTIYNGVDTDLFVPAPKPDKMGGRPTVVAAARVFPLKDIETMIHSCEVARRHVPDVRYLVYGSVDADPPYTKKCEDLVDALGVGGNFSLAGFHSKPTALFNEGDISILSSISEGFPYTVIESMACARPVVATDVGGVREALEGCGVLVKPRDAEGLGMGVVELLGDAELRQNLGRLARERVLLRFRSAASAGAYLESYVRLSRAHGARASLTPGGVPGRVPGRAPVDAERIEDALGAAV
jgi:glycosyltransferase involved in cell wall biosynthesis